MLALQPIDAGPIRLRIVRVDDAGAVARLMTPAISHRVLSWPEHVTPEQAAERITRVLADVAGGKALYFVIERRADAAVVGWISVIRCDEEATRGAIGYWVGEEYQGQGYMTAAAAAAVKAGFERLGLDVVEASAQTANERSFAIMRRLGMKPVSERTLWSASRGCSELCRFCEVSRAEFEAAVQKA